MGAYDFMWNSIQSGRISELEDKVEELEEKVEILHEWIEYFKQLKAQNDDS